MNILDNREESGLSFAWNQEAMKTSDILYPDISLCVGV